MKIKAHDLVGRALKRQGVDTAFFLMGGPMLGAMASCIDQGIRMIDVRHEQAAAFMAQAYARLRARPGVCMAASGPGAINLTTGLANALIDCAPVVALGGASPIGALGRGAFQEIDQVGIMRPVTKWAERVYDARRIPEMIDLAFRKAMAGKPGPVYLDMPGDVLHQEVEEDAIAWPAPHSEEVVGPPGAMPEAIARVIGLLREAERPIVLTGSGILYAQASRQLQEFVEAAGIPFYTTPQGRGVVPDDHEYSYPRMRSTALREADLVVVVGTRLNYVFGHGRPPRFAADARFVRIDIDPAEVSLGGNVAAGIVGDARIVLTQLVEALRGSNTPARYAAWRERLGTADRARIASGEEKLSNNQTPIHPLRLCKEVRDFMDREAIVVVDGQEILNYGRQSINTFFPGHRLNSGPFGTMGVGLPFGVGAKAARPDAQVIVLHGDGSFGLNAMELDTAVRLWMDSLTRDGKARNPVTTTIIGIMLRLVVWTMMLLSILANLGVNITAMVASLGVGGIAIALAVQTLLSDIFASLSIGIDKPFEIGDFVVFGEVAGTIEHIGLKTTRIRSLSGEQVVCANADLLKQILHNYKRMNTRRIVFKFGISYRTPSAKVREVSALVRRIIEGLENVKFDRAHFLSFDESQLTFEVVYIMQTSDYNKYMDVQQEINLALIDGLKELEVDFAHPTRRIEFIGGSFPELSVAGLAAGQADASPAREQAGPRLAPGR